MASSIANARLYDSLGFRTDFAKLVKMAKA